MIGNGNLGVVYQASRKNRPGCLALKFVEPQGQLAPEACRCVLEAMAAFQRLRHPHIVSLLETGSVHEGLYFLMDFCEGGNLAQYLQQHHGKLILGHARPLMLACLEALEHAHRQGLVHGDLKPQNILLDRQAEGRVWRIGDFGIARVLEKAGVTGMTATNQRYLSYQFMPRERILGLTEARFETDLWGAAAVFYYVLSGEFPYDFSQRDL